MIKRRKRIYEDTTVSAAPVSAVSTTSKIEDNKEEGSTSKENSEENTQETKEPELSEEEKKKQALEEIDKKDDADIMTMVLSGEMPEDDDIRAKIYKRGSDYIQKQMTGTITPEKQKEMFKKILANAGISEL